MAVNNFYRKISIASVILLVGCSNTDGKLSELATRGEKVYLNFCTACHHADPNQDGSAGPANAGSSQALLEAKILHGEYPAGYKPKRSSNVMPPLPQLEKEIPALAAYLAEIAK